MKTALSAMVLSLMLNKPALAQPTIPEIPGCVRPTMQNEHLCQSPTMRAAESEIHRLATKASSGSPMWWAITSEQNSWRLANWNPQATVSDRHTSYANRARQLQDIVAGTQTVLALSTSRKALAEECVVPPNLDFQSFLLKCRVAEVVGVAPGLIVQRHIWEGPGGEGVWDIAAHRLTSLIILEYTGLASDRGMSDTDTGWKPVAWADELEGWMDTPVVSENSHGTFITIPRFGGGTGAASRDVVVRKLGPVSWREIDALSWRREAERRVPPRLPH